MVEILSTSPLIGERTSFFIIPRPNKPFVSAKTVLVVILSPGFTFIKLGSCAGATPSLLAKLKGTTLPGKRVSATTVSAWTKSPFLTRT